MRLVFHRQLAHLLHQKGNDLLGAEFKGGSVRVVPRGAFRCFALVREKLDLVCDLDILFLRRDKPGHLITSGGDLDNRIKVLFDALKIPQDDGEPAWGTESGEREVLFCLTEDDALITGFRVTTDRLLEPPMAESEKNNVRLIVNVEVKATKMTPENMAYFSHF